MLEVLIGSGLAALAVFGLAWIASVLLGRVNVVDTAWGLGFLAIAATSFALSNRHGDAILRWLVLVLVCVWSLRLSVYMGIRSRGHGEDPRYDDYMSRAVRSKTLYSLTHVFLLQAVSAWFVSLPIQVVMLEEHGFFPLVLLGTLLWVVGFVFEALGDAQLAAFKGDPDNQGRVMSNGLWRYTRHPNYFGEACMWIGLFLIAAQHWVGLLTVASPILMTYFVVSKTGKPLLEKQLSQTKPGYADYVLRTSGFFPRRPYAPGLRRT